MHKRRIRRKKPPDPDDYLYMCPVCGREVMFSMTWDLGRWSKATGEVIYGEFPPLCRRMCLKALADDIYYTD